MRTYFRVSTTHDGKNTMNEQPGLKDVLDKIGQLRTISMPPGDNEGDAVMENHPPTDQEQGGFLG